MPSRPFKIPLPLVFALSALASLSLTLAAPGEPAAAPPAPAEATSAQQAPAPPAPLAAPPAPAAATTAEEAPAPPVPVAGPPLLWRIGGEQPSWLFGTIHLPDQRVTTLAPPVAQALASSEVVVTEIHLTAETRHAVTAGAMLPPDQSLTDLLPAPLVERTTAYLESRGLPFAPFTRMKIWALSTQLALLDYLPQMMMNPPLDMQLHTKAEGAGKRTDGLETVAEQMHVFDSLSIEEQIELHEKALDQVEQAAEKGTSPARDLVDAYLTGDLDLLMGKIEESMDPGDALSEKLLENLLTVRNRRMADRIAERIEAEQGTAWFFAVGAGHLGGDEGVVDLLRAKGLTVTRVPTAE